MKVPGPTWRVSVANSNPFAAKSASKFLEKCILPVVAFLRVIQLGRLLRLNQLVRTTRVFRLRGLVFRAWRAIVTLDVIDMIIRRDPSVRLERTKTLLAEKQDEIDVLRHEVTRLERLVAARTSEANEPCPVDSKEDAIR